MPQIRVGSRGKAPHIQLQLCVEVIVEMNTTISLPPEEGLAIYREWKDVRISAPV
jgi:hypothetical protein